MTGCPISYHLCDSTVTVYRNTPGGLWRRVVENAFFQWEQVRKENLTGPVHQRKFLLIVPGNEAALQPGDRIMEGVGPENIRWEELVPGLNGVGEAEYAFPCRWGDTVCHWEAGRR